MRGNTRGSSDPRSRLSEENGKCSFLSVVERNVMKSRQRRAYEMCGWQVEILVD